MKFEEIFNKAGWYVSDSFDEGVVIFIEPGPQGNEARFMHFNSVSDIAPVEFNMRIYRGLFNKVYKQVLNRQSLFGEKRSNLFK